LVLSGLSRSRHRRLLPPPPPPPAKRVKRPAPAPAPPSPPPSGPPPPLLPGSTDDQFSDVLPAFPLHGSRSAPLSNLRAGYFEIYTSHFEFINARIAQRSTAAALEAAIIQERVAALRLASADQRRRAAREKYCSLLGNVFVDSSPSPASGAPGRKEKARTSLR
jgi:hypothetical protein